LTVSGSVQTAQLAPQRAGQHSAAHVSRTHAATARGARRRAARLVHVAQHERERHHTHDAPAVRDPLRLVLWAPATAAAARACDAARSHAQPGAVGAARCVAAGAARRARRCALRLAQRREYHGRLVVAWQRHVGRDAALARADGAPRPQARPHVRAQVLRLCAAHAAAAGRPVRLAGGAEAACGCAQLAPLRQSTPRLAVHTCNHHWRRCATQMCAQGRHRRPPADARAGRLSAAPRCSRSRQNMRSAEVLRASPSRSQSHGLECLTSSQRRTPGASNDAHL